MVKKRVVKGLSRGKSKDVKKKVKLNVRKLEASEIKVRPKKVKFKSKKVGKISSGKGGVKEMLYVRTGVKGFDDLFEEKFGIPSGASVLIEGGPGSGKTIFCLSTVNSLCVKGKKCLYMSFEEPEKNLLNHMRQFGWDVDSFVKKGLLRVERFDALDVARSVEALLSAAKKELLIEIDPVLFPEDFKPDFVVIDSLSSIASAFSGEDSRFRVYMEQLFRYLEKNKITNFLVREVSTPTHIGTNFKEEGAAVSFLSDGIVAIYNVIYDSGSRGSALEIIKMRGSSFKREIVEMKINSKGGVEVFPENVISSFAGRGFRLT